MCLVLLPPDLMKPTFDAMHNKIKEKNGSNIIKLYKYYKDNWINGPNWSINDICQWGCTVRTNNDAERFHMKLMGKVEKANVEFYELVNILGNFATNTYMDARLFAQGLIDYRPKKKSLSFEKELLEASDLLRNKEISSFQFLNKVTSSKHDNQLVDETWGLDHSRVDLQPEVELDEEDLDSPESEFVDSDVVASDSD